MFWIQFNSVLEILTATAQCPINLPQSFLFPQWVDGHKDSCISPLFNYLHSTLCFSINCTAANVRSYKRGVKLQMCNILINS